MIHTQYFAVNCYFCIVNAICPMKIILILAISVILLLLAFVLLGVKVLFVKEGKFPSGHVHDHPEMRRRGIGCASRPE